MKVNNGAVMALKGSIFTDSNLVLIHLQQQISDQGRPARLVARAQSLAGIAMEKFIKEVMVPEISLGPFRLVGRVILVGAGIIAFKYFNESFGKLVGDLFQVHLNA